MHFGEQNVSQLGVLGNDPDVKSPLISPDYTPPQISLFSPFPHLALTLSLELSPLTHLWVSACPSQPCPDGVTDKSSGSSQSPRA